MLSHLKVTESSLDVAVDFGGTAVMLFVRYAVSEGTKACKEAKAETRPNQANQNTNKNPHKTKQKNHHHKKPLR